MGHPLPTNILFLFLIVIVNFTTETLSVDLGPLGWSKDEWEQQLEIVRQKHYPDFKRGSNGPIPGVIECVFNTPKKGAHCSDKFRDVLTIEVLFRSRYKSVNENCTTFGTEAGELILNPFVGDEIGSPIFLYREYSKWQEKMLNAITAIAETVAGGHHVCDPLKYLRCSAQNKCVCHFGSTWTPVEEKNPDVNVTHKNTCSYPHGARCDRRLNGYDTFDGALYFSPLEERTLHFGPSHAFRPKCRENNDYCWGLEFLKEANCIRRARYREIQDLGTYFINAQTLNLDDKCDFKIHNQYFTTTKEEDEDPEVRIKNMEVLRGLGTKFCDLTKFLTCGGSSDKCECMAPSFRKDGNVNCSLPPEFDSCTSNSKMDPIIFKNTSILYSAKDNLMEGWGNIVTACQGKLKCHMDMKEQYCTCPNGTTGQDCEEKLTKFLTRVRITSLPTDVKDEKEKLKIFSEFNKRALKFQDIFKLGENSPCVWETQTDAESIVSKIRKLGYVGTKMTQKQYDDLGKSMDNFTLAHQSQGICSETLRCQYTSKTCVRETRKKYFEDLTEELRKGETLRCNQTGCSNPPRFLNIDTVGGDQFNFFGGESDMERKYNEVVQEHSKLLKEKAKFCKEGSGFCSISELDKTTKRCECEEDINTGVDPTESNSNSSRHLQSQLTITMIFASVLVFYKK